LPEIDVDGLVFEVPGRYIATKYDSWTYYRRQISRIYGAKAIDLLIVERDASTAFFVEVKDFRPDPVTLERRIRTKPSELPDEVAAKVLDSLGGILAARTMATSDAENCPARIASKALKLRVVLHLEQAAGSRLFPMIVDPATLQIKLRQVLKSVDPHAAVVSQARMGGLPWAVR